MIQPISLRPSENLGTPVKMQASTLRGPVLYRNHLFFFVHRGLLSDSADRTDSLLLRRHCYWEYLSEGKRMTEMFTRSTWGKRERGNLYTSNKHVSVPRERKQEIQFL